VSVTTGKVELGQGLHAALRRVVAEELDVDPRRIDIVSADTAISPDEGLTAGSLSVSTTGQRIAAAAAAARACLIEALGPETAGGAVTVEDGRLHRNGQPLGADYWTLSPKVSLARPFVGVGAPKTSDRYALLGRPGPGHDLTGVLSGAAFIQDMELPDMLHARLVRPPFPGAVLETIGIELPVGVQLVRDGGFLGVLAEDEHLAVRTAERIERRASWSGAAEASDPLLRLANADRMPADPVEAPSTVRTVSAAVSRPFLSHASIGLCCALALWDGATLTVWTHSQGVFQLRSALAKLLALGLDVIRVRHVNGAGCYGHNGADDVAADAALLALAAPNRPVRVLWTRAQELAAAPLAPAMRTLATATLDDAGRIAEFHTEIVSYPHLRRPDFGGANLLAGYLRAGPAPEEIIIELPLAFGGGAGRNGEPYYDIPVRKVDVNLVESPPVRTSAMRSLGAHVNVCAIEAAMDRAAEAVGEDPVTFRLRHLSDARARAVLTRAADAAGWPGDRDLGVGFARYKNSAAYCAVVARVVLDDAVRAPQFWCAVDAGRVVDPDGLRGQVEGGVIQATSWTLKEMIPFAGGRPDVSGWSSYPILTFPEAPEIVTDTLDHPSEPSLGVAEASSGPAAAAICNALARILGQPVLDFPLTRDRILTVLA
jgi:nicotinate dehydrogenase subunit B